jgi:hypothetical protein
MGTLIVVDCEAPFGVGAPSVGDMTEFGAVERLLGPEITDVDGNREDRRLTVPVFNGPPPELRTFPGEESESGAVGTWLGSLSAEVFSRTRWVCLSDLRRRCPERSRRSAQRSRSIRPSSRRSSRDQTRQREHRHHAPGEGARVPSCRRHGV